MLLATKYRQQNIDCRGWHSIGGFVGSEMGGAFLAIGGFTAIGIFCLAAVGISALVMRLALREPDEGLA